MVTLFNPCVTIKTLKCIYYFKHQLICIRNLIYLRNDAIIGMSTIRPHKFMLFNIGP